MISAEITRLVKAFGYSLQGLKVALDQPAFRIELLLFVGMTPLAFLITTDGLERALLIGSILLVMMIELLNSAVETVVDRISLEHHELSGRAKDLASAAVLVSIFNAAIIWLCVVV